MFCPHCHNKIPDGSNFCPLCYANLVGVKQQEKESAAETDAPRPKQKPAPRKNNAKPAYTKGSRQSKRAQDKTPMIIAIGLILILVLIIVMIVRSMFGAGAPAVVNTPVPQATQQPQQENNFIVFGATNTPAPQLTATPNIEITPTPAPQAPAMTTYKTLRKGDRGKSVISMQEALIKLGYLKSASDGNFGTGTKTAVENFQKENGLDVDGIAGARKALHGFRRNADSGCDRRAGRHSGSAGLSERDYERGCKARTLQPLFIKTEYKDGHEKTFCFICIFSADCDGGLRAGRAEADERDGGER